MGLRFRTHRIRGGGGPSSVEPPAAPCSEGAGLNRAGLVRGARPRLSLKPEAGAQAGYLFRSRIIPAYFGANWRQLAAGFSARILQNFCNLQQLVRFARDALVNVFGLTAPLSMPASANFFYFCSFLFDEQIYFPRRRNGDDRAAAHWFGGLSENNGRSESV